jgi:hypothetical protein
MNITGSLLASWWHNRVPKDDVPESETVADTKETAKAEII